MDSVRTAKRLGAERAIIIYRRSRHEMPAREEEVKHAEEEGIEFHFLTTPIRYMGDEHGRLRAMECLRMELGEPDASGRRRPVPVAGSEFTTEVDLVVVAIGQSPNPLIPQTTPGLKVGKWGNIEVDWKTMATSLPGRLRRRRHRPRRGHGHPGHGRRPDRPRPRWTNTSGTGDNAPRAIPRRPPSNAHEQPDLFPAAGGHIGTDESGKGDYFGPLVIAGFFLPEGQDGRPPGARGPGQQEDLGQPLPRDRRDPQGGLQARRRRHRAREIQRALRQVPEPQQAPGLGPRPGHREHPGRGGLPAGP